MWSPLVRRHLFNYLNGQYFNHHYTITCYSSVYSPTPYGMALLRVCAALVCSTLNIAADVQAVNLMMLSVHCLHPIYWTCCNHQYGLHFKVTISLWSQSRESNPCLLCKKPKFGVLYGGLKVWLPNLKMWIHLIVWEHM